MPDWKATLQLFIPKFYNKLTWFLVVSGVTLTTSPLWEKVIEETVKHYLDIDLSTAESPAYGFGLIVIGIIYNLGCKLVECQSNGTDQQPVVTGNLTPAQKHDVELYEQLITLLPPNRVVPFAKEHDFGASYDRRDCDPYYILINEWDQADHEFQNVTIEEGKKELIKLASTFIHLLGRFTYPLPYGTLSRVFLDSDPYDAEREARERKNAEKINAAATEFFNHYDKFIRETKRTILN